LLDPISDDNTMTQLFTESPWLLMVFGSLGILAGIAGWIQTGERWLVYVGIAFLIATPLLVLFERWWVTDREALRMQVDAIAADLQANRHDAVFAAISDQSPEVQRQAKSELPGYRFEEVRVTGYDEIRVFTNDPREAIVPFYVYARVSSTHGLFKNETVSRKVKLTFVLEDGRWHVTSYEHEAPVKMRGAN
jgi:hypothetical protein